MRVERKIISGKYLTLELLLVDDNYLAFQVAEQADCVTKQNGTDPAKVLYQNNGLKILSNNGPTYIRSGPSLEALYVRGLQKSKDNSLVWATFLSGERDLFIKRLEAAVPCIKNPENVERIKELRSKIWTVENSIKYIENKGPEDLLPILKLEINNYQEEINSLESE